MGEKSHEQRQFAFNNKNKKSLHNKNKKMQNPKKNKEKKLHVLTFLPKTLC